MFAAESYNNTDGSFDGTTTFRPGNRDCLIVHGNTEVGGENSLFKDWGRYSCSSRFSAVICQLNIDVHTNGDLTTTSTPSPTTSTSTFQSTSTTSSRNQQPNSTVTNRTPNSRRSRSLLFRIAHDRLNATTTTSAATPLDFDTLQTLSVVHFSNALDSIEEMWRDNSTETSMKIILQNV